MRNEVKIGEETLSWALVIDRSAAQLMRCLRLGIGDPYQDFATLNQSAKQWLMDETKVNEFIHAFFSHYGILEPDMVKLDYFRRLNDML